MRDWFVERRKVQEDPGQALEEESTRLLREAGAFQRGKGILSPRAERAADAGRVPWQEWGDRRVVEVGPHSVFRTLADLAEALGLSATQRELLYLHRVEELSYRQVARVMGLTVWRVRVLLRRAEERWRLCRHTPPVSIRELFWEEIRQKKASVYHAPVRWRRPGRRTRRKATRERAGGATGRSAGEARAQPVS